MAFNFWRFSESVGKTRDRKYKDFYIQYDKSFKSIEGESWRLNVTGACENPQRLTLEALKGFPRKKQVSRLKCVECWWAKAEWEGFTMADLDDRVRPLPEAVGVLFHCADRSVEYLT
ncbi:molybdopterin-dependent oxidoreductase [bacterium AH-315-L15]|nr:molybdopterin-dependent oxidoreductase [bacterium AH-315-L15]